jgi:hypothetical protein
LGNFSPRQETSSMSFMVVMVRESAKAGGRNRFSCSSAAWDLLLDLGRDNGWKPSGTSYARNNAAAAAVPAPVRHGYRPGNHRDYKRIDAEDAVAWARSLSEARRSPQLAAVIGERPGPVVLREGTSVEELRSANAPFPAVMDEFIEYAFGGEFAFALDK